MTRSISFVKILHHSVYFYILSWIEWNKRKWKIHEIFYLRLGLFRLGESFVSTSWPADPPTIEVDDGSTKKQMLDISPNEVIGDSSDNIETSEEEDASSSVTITSPRASDHPSTMKTELNKPPIG